jgi:hypothetical protein
MTDYVQANNFTSKDDLPAGTGGEKRVMGFDWDEEFALIITAITSKYDSTDLSDQSTAQAGTSNTVLETPLRAAQTIASAGFNNLADREDNWTVSRLTADSVLTTSFATIFNDIVFSAAGVYEVMIFLAFTGSGSGEILGVKVTLDTTPQGFALAFDHSGGAGGFNTPASAASGTAVQVSIASNGAGTLFCRGVFKHSVSGTLDVDARYVVSGGTGVITLKANSYVAIRRVS